MTQHQQQNESIRGFQIAREAVLSSGTTLHTNSSQLTQQQNILTQPQRTIHKSQSIVYANATANSIQIQPTQFQAAKLQRQTLQPSTSHQLLNRAIQRAQKIQSTLTTSTTPQTDKLVVKAQ